MLLSSTKGALVSDNDVFHTHGRLPQENPTWQNYTVLSANHSSQNALIYISITVEFF
jgi:hypothetical protein